MSLRCAFTLLSLLLATVARTATTQVATDQPIVNFRLPDFTPEGHRSWLVRGSEARYVGEGQIKIKELNLTIFSGLADARVETLILSPSAEVSLGDRTVRGGESIRIINDRFEATGRDWSYSHQEKKVSIARNVHVILHTELKDLLK